MANKSEPSSDSAEEETPENSRSGEDDSDRDTDDCSENDSKEKSQKSGIVSEYEKQRLSRIAENKARMEALGITKIAASIKSSNNKRPRNRASDRKGKGKVFDDDDEDYRPNDDDEVHKDDDDDDDDDDDEDFLSNETPRSRKIKKRSPKVKKAGVKKQLSCSDFVDGSDEELMQAIALSLQDSPKDGASKRKGKTSASEDTRSRKKKPFASRVQMTEDDVILHFFQFDEAGKGNITIRDLERVAIANDFIWTEKELADMITYFDCDRDGKINLSDFQKIVARLNMIRGSDNT